MNQVVHAPEPPDCAAIAEAALDDDSRDHPEMAAMLVMHRNGLETTRGEAFSMR